MQRALKWSVAASAIVVLAALLFLGIQPRVESIFIAIRNRDLALLQKTLSQDPGQLNHVLNGRTPLHLAALGGKLAMLKTLARAGAELEARDADGNTPLHLAALRKYYWGVIALLELGADVNAANDFGHTPLMIAAHNNIHASASQALLKAAPREIHDHAALSDLQKAAARHNPALAGMLRKLP